MLFDQRKVAGVLSLDVFDNKDKRKQVDVLRFGRRKVYL